MVSGVELQKITRITLIFWAIRDRFSSDLREYLLEIRVIGAAIRYPEGVLMSERVDLFDNTYSNFSEQVARRDPGRDFWQRHRPEQLANGRRIRSFYCLAAIATVGARA